MSARPRPLPALLLAQLAAVAACDARARLDPDDHDDLSDRHRGPREITDADYAEHERLYTLSEHLERRARRARFSGRIWTAFDGGAP